MAGIRGYKRWLHLLPKTHLEDSFSSSTRQQTNPDGPRQFPSSRQKHSQTIQTLLRSAYQPALPTPKLNNEVFHGRLCPRHRARGPRARRLGRQLLRLGNLGLGAGVPNYGIGHLPGQRVLHLAERLPAGTGRRSVLHPTRGLVQGHSRSSRLLLGKFSFFFLLLYFSCPDSGGVLGLFLSAVDPK